jgi:hypothetical protein
MSARTAQHGLDMLMVALHAANLSLVNRCKRESFTACYPLTEALVFAMNELSAQTDWSPEIE